MYINVLVKRKKKSIKYQKRKAVFLAPEAPSFWNSSNKKATAYATINTCAVLTFNHLSFSLFCIFFCLCFLPLPQQEAQQSSADFRFYIENHTRNPDDLSRKQVRIYQLYSRTTGKHVQILGKNINANGDDGGKYGMGELLCISPDTYE